ncbi:MAG TPA: hypothetical protein VH500_05825 [Nitrososphaeraceae archaeon]|jgi:hypothetical protein
MKEGGKLFYVSIFGMLHYNIQKDNFEIGQVEEHMATENLASKAAIKDSDISTTYCYIGLFWGISFYPCAVAVVCGIPIYHLMSSSSSEFGQGYLSNDKPYCHFDRYCIFDTA